MTEKDAALIEAMNLLDIAHSAMVKMGLWKHGDDVRLPHETRMFALYFSPVARSGPGELQIQGLGRYDELRNEIRGLLK